MKPAKMQTTKIENEKFNHKQKNKNRNEELKTNIGIQMGKTAHANETWEGKVESWNLNVEPWNLRFSKS